MQITISNKEGKFSKIARKLTFIFFGIFLTSLIFTFSLKYFNKSGIWLGLFICGLIIFLSVYYTEKGSKLRLIAYSILGSIIGISILFFTGVSIVSSLLKDI